MLKSNKILLGWLAFLFVIGHTLAIVFYALPEGVVPTYLKNKSAAYVTPVFEQTWSLFAPCPIHDDKLRVNYYFDGDSTGWTEPMQTVHEQHNTWRFTHHSDLVLGESNLLYYVGNDLDYMGISLYQPFPVDSSSSFKNTSGYWMMYNYLYGVADYNYQKEPDSARAECSFHNVKTGESGSLILPIFRWTKKS